jgi:hypothetical protein
MSRRAMNGVLAGFLGTYTSRYSDYHGYWLFGFLVADLDRLVIDLLGADSEPQAGPSAVAASIARERFADQLAKAGLSPVGLREAQLELTRESGTGEVWVDGWRDDGNALRFTVRVRFDTGRRFEQQPSGVRSAAQRSRAAQ